MRNNAIAKISLYIIISLSILLLSTVAYAVQCSAPTMGASFYGDASVNGRDVPASSKVIARIGGETRGEITVTAAGEYGNSASDTKLGVDGCSNETGIAVEFYVKMPGYQEIKAAQTSTWQSGVVTKIDLTFTGTEVKETTSTPSSNDNGGSSSGGGSDSGSNTGSGGGPSQVDQNSASYYYAEVQPDNQISISLRNENIPVIKLQFILKNSLEAVNLQVKAVDSPNVNKLDDVYKYISIESPKITDDNVKIAIIRFQIPNEWFEDNNYDPDQVKLYRYHDNKWEELETIFEGSDATNHQYRAGTPGFSYFAIKSEKAAVTVAKEETEEQTAPQTEETPEQEIGSKSPFTGIGIQASPLIGVAIIVTILIIGLALIFFYQEKNKKMGGKKK
jgi:PGF-pre-PGF domain-containing protein